MSYASTALALSPAAYYRMGEASGTTMVDSSGNGRDGTYTGVTLGTAGLLVGDSDTCGDFSGLSDSRGEVPDAAWMDSTAFTVVALINSDNFSSRRGIVTRDGTTASRGWNLYANVGKLELFDAGGSRLTAATSMSTGTTYHVAMVSDGTTVNCYLNGVLDGSVTYSVSNALANSIMVGASRAGSAVAASFEFDGRIDEALYYTTALSATDIINLYTAATTAGNTAAGTASLSLSASGGAGATGAGSASLSLSASGTATAVAVGSASLAFDASGTGVPPGGGAGDATLTLTASGTAGAGVVGSASLAVSATGAARGRAAGAANLTLSAGGTGNSIGPYPDAVLADAPIAYWRLGDATDTGFPTTAHDSSGHGHDGTYDAAMKSDAPGAIAGDSDLGTAFGGSALGTHDMQVPFWSGLNTAEFTYESWLEVVSVPSDNPLFGRTGNPAPVHVSNDAGGRVVVHVNSGTTSATYSGNTPAWNKWHHLAITRDAAGTLSIYVDGTLDAEFSNSLEPNTATSEGFEVGALTSGVLLDELALYDYALPANRVAAHYLIGHGASGGASLTLTASGTVTGVSARGTASLTLSALGQVPTPAAGSAVLTLTAGGIALALYETDTSNALDGLDLLLTATVIFPVPVATPPASVAAMHYDKALAYPTPTMVGGRPT